MVFQMVFTTSSSVVSPVNLLLPLCGALNQRTTSLSLACARGIFILLGNGFLGDGTTRSQVTQVPATQVTMRAACHVTENTIAAIQKELLK